MLELFFLATGGAFALFTFTADRKSLGIGFYQLHLTVGAFCLFMALVFSDHGQPSFATWRVSVPQIAGVLALFCAVSGTFAWSSPAKNLAAYLQAASGFLPLGILGWWLVFIAVETEPDAQFFHHSTSYGFIQILAHISLALSGAGIAAATIGMNVGHWYLVRPRLGGHHLSGSTALLCGILLFRAVFTLPAIIALLMGKEPLLGSATALFLVGARLIIGLAAPLVLAFLAHASAQIRSTQSATGLLFPLLFLLIIGEMLSLFLNSAYAIYPW